jgi:hypothetical protein
MNFSHWQYFLALCEDLQETTRFVELTSDNFKTYSIEYTRLYLAAGSEIDVVAKQLCETIDSSARAGSINEYRQLIVPKYPELPTVAVVVWRYGVTRIPWRDWAGDANPRWWTCYNRVKHQRHLDYKEANLENTLDALAGLLVMVGYLYGRELANRELRPMPNFMGFEKYCIGSIMKGDGYYLLPGIPKPSQG